jgi:hypothetical protein
MAAACWSPLSSFRRTFKEAHELRIGTAVPPTFVQPEVKYQRLSPCLVNDRQARVALGFRNFHAFGPECWITVAIRQKSHQDVGPAKIFVADSEGGAVTARRR